MKKLLLTLLTLMATIAVNAGQVSRQQALQKAQKFMPGKQFEETKAYARSEGSSDTEPFYIFNVENNGGFVIVSGDDHMKSILGYAEHGNFNLENMPENVRWWLGQYENAATSLNTATPISIINRSTTRNGSELKDAIEPFVNTTWGQGFPYNQQCPTINDQNCLTGCVATAMAQVINYTKWPKKGITTEATIPFYKTKTHNISMPKLEKTEFDWENMTDDEISKLMLYCGQSVKMDYGLESSSALDANIPQGMIWYFGFDRGLQITYRNAYDTKDWNTILYEELKNRRPIIYGGQSGSDGHSFIIDGYQDGMYYINWGWYGNYDGYYELSALDPTFDQSFTKDQIAVIGIQAPNGKDDSIILKWDIVRMILEGLEEMTRESSSEDFPAFTITSSLNNKMLEDAFISVGYGLFNGNTLIEILSEEKRNTSVGENITYEATVSFGKGISDGIYQIKVISRGSETEEWLPAEGSSYRFIESEIKGNSMINTIKPEFELDERLKFNIIEDGKVEVKAANRNIYGDITIPELIIIDGKEYEVTQLATFAFSETQIKSIFIPKSIKTIQQGAFRECPNLTSINVEDGNPSYYSIDGVVYKKVEVWEYNVGYYNASILVAYPSGKEDEEYYISEKCVTIEDYAFLGNTFVEKIVFPEGDLRRIGMLAFYGCHKLSSITIPQSITFIGRAAFNECSSLTSITVKHPRAISYNNANEDIFDKETYEQATLYVPKGRASHYKEQIGWGKFNNIEELEMPDVIFSPEPFVDFESNQMILGFFGNNDVGSNYIGGETPGLYKVAIKLSEARMDPFTNNKITHIRFGLEKNEWEDVSRIKNVKVWISSTLDGSYIYSQDVQEIKNGWNVVQLNQPFFITGKEICIGYEFQMTSACYPIAVTIGAQCENNEEGSGYFYSPTIGDESFHWHREKGSTFCAASIQALVEGNNLPLYDLRPQKNRLGSIKKYYTSDEKIHAWGGVKNCGKRTIDNFDLGVMIDNEKPQFFRQNGINSQQITPTNQWLVEASPGKHELKIYIDKINGEKPLYTKDDTIKVDVVVLQEPLNRHKTLVDYYTTTSQDVKDFDDTYNSTKNNLSILAIHLEDELTCKAGEELSWLANGLPSSNIPDRAVRVGQNFLFADCNPLVDGSMDGLDLLASVADINVEAKYSTDNILLITIKGYRTKDFFNLYENTNLYVMLTEDGVIAPQVYDNAVVDDYSHNWVLRANVSNIWGDPIMWNGNNYEMTYVYRLKDNWKRENMKVVAFLGNPFNGDNYDDLQILNCNDFELKNAQFVDLPDIFVEDNIVYKKLDDNSVAISGNGSADGNVTIPKTINHQGMDYLVKGISPDAFKGNTLLTRVTIPESIEQIGERAFAGCNSLEAIYCYAKEPIVFGSMATVRTRADGKEKLASTVFAEVNKETCILYVPKKSGEKYRNAEGWCEFKNIVEMVSNVLGDANDDEEVDYKDIDAIVEYIMNGKTENFIFNNADANLDGKVDAADIVLIIEMIK